MTGSQCSASCVPNVKAFAARLTQDQTQRQLVADLVQRAFGGSAAALLQQALSAQPASPDELKKIKKLIADYKKGSSR